MWGRGLWYRKRYWQPVVNAPRGYTYIGPCRCGRGPNAFFYDSAGRIVNVRQLYQWQFPQELTKEDLKVELEILKREKTELERNIEELENQLKED